MVSPSITSFFVLVDPPPGQAHAIEHLAVSVGVAVHGQRTSWGEWVDPGAVSVAQDARQALVEEINQELDEAIDSCEKEKYAEPEEAYIDVYSEQFPVRREEF